MRDLVRQNAEQLPEQGPLRNAFHEGGQLVLLNRGACADVANSLAQGFREEARAGVRDIEAALRAGDDAQTLALSRAWLSAWEQGRSVEACDGEARTVYVDGVAMVRVLSGGLRASAPPTSTRRYSGAGRQTRFVAAVGDRNAGSPLGTPVFTAPRAQPCGRLPEVGRGAAGRPTLGAARKEAPQPKRLVDQGEYAMSRRRQSMKKVWLRAGGIVLLVACDAGPPLPPANAAELTEVVTTRYDSDRRYDYWACTSDAGTAYILLPAPGALGDEQQRGKELATLGEQGFDTLWRASGPDSLHIEYPALDQAFDFTELTFQDVDNVRIGGGANAPQTCVRGQYGVEGSTAPGGVPGLAAMYGIAVFRILPSGYFGLDDDAILAFEDGSYTEDLRGVMRDGVDASRAANPDDWGIWRERGGALELQGANDTSFEEPTNAWVIEPGAVDERLDGCFTATGGVGPLAGGGIGSVDFSTVCFWPDATFTHERAVWAQGPGSSVVALPKGTAGAYRVDGNSIQFDYNDGRKERLAFGFNIRPSETEGGSIYLDDDLHID